MTMSTNVNVSSTTPSTSKLPQAALVGAILSMIGNMVILKRLWAQLLMWVTKKWLNTCWIMAHKLIFLMCIGLILMLLLTLN